MKAIYKRELTSYFKSFTGYLFIAIVLAGVGIAGITNSENSANFALTLYYASALFVFAAPLLTMKSFADEKANSTDKLLYSLPIKLKSIVAGKYLAMLTILLIPTVIIALYPAMLNVLGGKGAVAIAPSLGALVAFFLLGALWLAFGMLISSVTSGRVSSAIFAFIVTFVVYSAPSVTQFLPEGSQASLIALSVLVILIVIAVNFITKGGLASWVIFLLLELPLVIVSLVNSDYFDGMYGNVVSAASPFEMMINFTDGIFDLRYIGIYLGLCIIFTQLTAYFVTKRRRSFNQ